MAVDDTQAKMNADADTMAKAVEVAKTAAAAQPATAARPTKKVRSPADSSQIAKFVMPRQEWPVKVNGPDDLVLNISFSATGQPIATLVSGPESPPAPAEAPKPTIKGKDEAVFGQMPLHRDGRLITAVLVIIALLIAMWLLNPRLDDRGYVAPTAAKVETPAVVTAPKAEYQSIECSGERQTQCVAPLTSGFAMVGEKDVITRYGNCTKGEGGLICHHLSIKEEGVESRLFLLEKDTVVGTIMNP